MERIQSLNGSAKPDLEYIAVSEYNRALRLMNMKNEFCITLFHELLETEIISEIACEMSDNVLFQVKYNCLKHLGTIYLVRGEGQKALEYFLEAQKFDNTDVYFMHKFGKLAFELNHLELAYDCFNQCLKISPNHFPSADEILQILCAQENFMEAYGWALLWYSKKNKYQRSIDVILDIREKFVDFGLQAIEGAWRIKFTDNKTKRSTTKSAFPLASYDELQPEECTNFKQYKLTECTWWSFGSMLKTFYETTEHSVANLGCELNMNDIWPENVETDENNNNAATNVVKSVRASAAYNQTEINNNSLLNDSQGIASKLVTFQQSTSSIFQQFLIELNAKPFDMLTLMFNWLKYIAMCWEKKLPIELCSLYKDIYQFHSKHYDLTALNSLEVLNIQQFFQIGLFFLELSIDRNYFSTNVSLDETNLNIDWYRLLFHLMITFSFNNLYTNLMQSLKYELRLQWLHFQYKKEQTQFEEAISILEIIQEKTNGVFSSLEFPNVINYSRIDVNVIEKEMTCLHCDGYLLEIYSTDQPHDLEKLIRILFEYFQIVQDFEANEKIELLLVSLLRIKRFTECLKWSEVFLHNSAILWQRRDQNNRHVSKKLLKNIQFLLSITKEVLQNDEINCIVRSSFKCVMPRLLITIRQFIDIQFSAKYANRTNDLFNSETLVIIVHLILQQELNLQSPEDGHPKILNFFCEIIMKLADHRICRRDNIPALLYIFDSIVMFDNVKNNFENFVKFNFRKCFNTLTSQLFGFPKASSQRKTIEILTWNRSIHLFNLHQLWNSKITEITSELFTLMLRIISQMPVHIDTEIKEKSKELEMFVEEIVDFPSQFLNKMFPDALIDIFYLVASYIQRNTIKIEPVKYFFMDLSINPRRFESWFGIMQLKIKYFEEKQSALMDDFTINQLMTITEEIDFCFEKCKQLRPKNVALLECYGLYSYQLYSILSCESSTERFGDRFIKYCVTCLQDAETAFHRAVRQNKKWIYYYMLGKVNEKRNWNRLESYLKYYLLAEKQQLVTNNGHRNDSDVEMLEINFRITISIFKYARKIPENVDAEMSKYLCKILNRPTSLVSFIIGKEKLKNSDEIVCYERNESWVVIGGVNQHVNKIIELCIRDFEHFNLYKRNYYKVKYTLINIYLRMPDQIRNFEKCNDLLLSHSTNSTGQYEPVSGLFQIDRNKSLFVGFIRLQSFVIDRHGCFNKYVEKCVQILIEFLMIKSNTKLLFELAIQWKNYMKKSSNQYVRCDQQAKIMQHILDSMFQMYKEQLNQKKTENKFDLELFLNLIELCDCFKDTISENKLQNLFGLLQQFYEIYINIQLHAGNNEIFTQSVNDPIKSILEQAIVFGQNQLKKRDKSLVDIKLKETSKSMPSEKIKKSKVLCKKPKLLLKLSDKSKVIKKEKKDGVIYAKNLKTVNEMNITDLKI